MSKKRSMSSKELKNYFKKAQKEKWAIGQFNISNLETLRGIILAAKNLKSPVIIGTSEGESKFLGLKQAAALVRVFREETKLPIILNLDHGRSLDYIKKAINAGYDAVHFDGSHLSLAKNIVLTKKVVKHAKKFGVFIEGEVGSIKGSSQILKKIPETEEEDLTNPEEAQRFVKETGVDSLAINVGTFHGMKSRGKNPHVNQKRLKEIKEKVGDRVFLVLHGGSGTPEKDIKLAIKTGIVKININTETRVAFTKSLKKALARKPEEVVPYKYMPEVVKAIEKVIEEKIKLFTQAKRN